MELKEFLEMMERRETVHTMSDAMMFSGQMTQRALEITAKLNTGYHPLEEVQEIFSELTGKDVRGKLFLFRRFIRTSARIST